MEMKEAIEEGNDEGTAVVHTTRDDEKKVSSSGHDEPPRYVETESVNIPPPPYEPSIGFYFTPNTGNEVQVRQPQAYFSNNRDNNVTSSQPLVNKDGGKEDGVVIDARPDDVVVKQPMKETNNTGKLEADDMLVVGHGYMGDSIPVHHIEPQCCQCCDNCLNDFPICRNIVEDLFDLWSCPFRFVRNMLRCDFSCDSPEHGGCCNECTCCKGDCCNGCTCNECTCCNGCTCDCVCQECCNCFCPCCKEDFDCNDCDCCGDCGDCGGC